ncbi:hypothetical protein ACGFLS_19545 [Streptomyces abikoensis]|uniref:hypothetical protein n=1 Tax=Streptomyces abikoensis TaxID=97398 RepID=UPI003712E9B3
MRLIRTAVAALAGLLLAVALPGSTAFAANGQFLWVGPKGKAYSIQNPPDNKCYDMGQEARAARNETKSPLVVYSKKKCKGDAIRIAPGQQAPQGTGFQSVIFNPR